MKDQLLETFNNAPEIIKIRAAATNAAFRRMLAAEKQYNIWAEELANARGSYTSEEKEFHTILNRWNPTTNELEAPEIRQ